MAQGTLFSFGDTVTTKQTIASIIHNIDPQDVPCISYFGLNNQTGRFSLQNFANHRYEWLEDTLRPRADAIDEAGNVSSGDTDFNVDDATKFKPGDVIKVGDEKIWIGAVNYTTNNLSGLVRGWGSTTAAAHNDNAEVEYLFSARLEGADSDTTVYTVPTSPYNYSQILHAEISVSGSEQDATSRYGINDQYKYQLMKWIGGAGAGNGRQGRAGDLMIDLEKTFFYGERIQRTSTVAGATGGYETFVTTNAENRAGALLTPEALEDVAEACWRAGGKPNVMMCNAFNKRLISSFYAGTIRTERSERTGGVVINTIETEFGNFDVMLNRWMPNDRVYITSREDVGWVTLRPFFVQQLGITGDKIEHQIVGEYGFALKNEKASGYIYNTATSFS